jgi:hypothetical protein
MGYARRLVGWVCLGWGLGGGGGGGANLPHRHIFHRSPGNGGHLLSFSIPTVFFFYQSIMGVIVGTCSQLQGDPTRVNNDVNRVPAQDDNSSVNLASQGHCAGVFIGIRVPSVLC